MAMIEIGSEAMERLRRFDVDGIWFDVHYRELRKKYKGNLILVVNKQIEAYAPNRELLKEAARKKGIDISQHFVGDIPEKEYIPIFHFR